MKAWSKTFELSLGQFGNNLFIHISILLAGTLIVAFVADKLFLAWLKKIVAKKDGHNPLISTKHSVLYYSILLLGLTVAVHLASLPDKVHEVIIALITTVAILFWARFLYRITRFLLHGVAEQPDTFMLVNSKSLPMFENTVFIFAIAITIYFVFVSWNIDMTAWLASAGIIGIAVGFAAKDTLANLFSGLFIMADAPYKIGDMVVLDTGERGEITKIGIRSTRMRTRDDAEVTIPNSIMGNTKILNESGGQQRKSRICVQVSVAYGSDIDRVREILTAIGNEDPATCSDPEVRVRFRRFGASGLEFELLCWIEEQALKGRIMDSLNCNVYKAFREQGIEIPYAKQDIFIKELPPRPTDK